MVLLVPDLGGTADRMTASGIARTFHDPRGRVFPYLTLAHSLRHKWTSAATIPLNTSKEFCR